MEVRISLDQLEPPVGRLAVASAPDVPEQARPGVPFTGWLGLLHALSDAIGSAGDAPIGPGL